jgi:hypothetical protein
VKSFTYEKKPLPLLDLSFHKPEISKVKCYGDFCKDSDPTFLQELLSQILKRKHESIFDESKANISENTAKFLKKIKKMNKISDRPEIKNTVLHKTVIEYRDQIEVSRFFL